MKIKKNIRCELKFQSSVCPMNSIRKLFLHSETYCSNLPIYFESLNCSIGFENRTQLNSHTIFLVRLRSISEPIEPSCSIKFDWVPLSSISEQFDCYVGSILMIVYFLWPLVASITKSFCRSTSCRCRRS